MAITTWAEVQAVLELDAGRQAHVEALIPHVEEDYLRIRNKPFDVGNVLTVTAPATAAGDITVTVNGSDFNVPVLNGDNAITVARKINNALSRLLPRGVFSTSANTVTFQGHHTLTFNGGTTGVTATVSGTDTVYPIGAEYTAIKMIQFKLTAAQGAGISSESLGDYSIVYDTALGSKISDYPKSIVGGIQRYVNFT